MRRFLQKLRKKPKSTRRKIAFGTSASITGVIFAVWLTVMLAGGGVGMTTGSTNQDQAASPLSALEGNADSALAEARERLSASGSASSSATTTSGEGMQDKSVQPSKQTSDDQQYWEPNESKNNPKGDSQEVSGENPAESDSQTTDSQPYWKANDSKGDDSAENTQPPSQVGKDFWRDSGEGKEGNGWF